MSHYREKGLFRHCPRVLICCDRSCNNCIYHLHGKALRIVYNDNLSSFEDLLPTDQSVSIHHRNIHLLWIELCKTRSNISNHIINELFRQLNILYNLQSQTEFTAGPISTVK